MGCRQRRRRRGRFLHLLPLVFLEVITGDRPLAKWQQGQNEDTVNTATAVELLLD